MCGIVYQHTNHPKDITLGKRVWKRYKDQQKRGRQGFGFYANGHIVRSATEKRINRQLFKRPAKAILFHHRYPTSSENTKAMAHPFSTGDYFGNVQYVFVHNGVLKDYAKFEDKHRELGIEYQRDYLGDFNDSEALMWEFALWHQGQQEDIEITGDAAIIAIERRRKTKRSKWKDHAIHYGRNTGRPLVMTQNQHHLTLASEGKGDPVMTDVLYSYNYSTRQTTSNASFKIKQYKYVSYNKANASAGYTAGYLASATSTANTYNGNYSNGYSDSRYDHDYDDERLWRESLKSSLEDYLDVDDEDYEVLPSNTSKATAKELKDDADIEFWNALELTDGDYVTALDFLDLQLEEAIEQAPKSYSVSVLQYAKNMLFNDDDYRRGELFHSYWEGGLSR